MNRAASILLATILLTAPAMAAETIDAGPFSVDATPQLTIRYNGKPLFSGDRCVSFRGLKPREPVLVDPAKGRVVRKGNIITVLAKKGRNTLRREILVTPEAVHVTYELRVFGYTGGSHLQYDLLSSAESLDGVAYEARIGAPRGPIKKTAATFSTTATKPGQYILQTARYFVLKHAGGECSLDFNPSGAWLGETNYGDQYATSPYYDGKLFHFPALCSGGRFGGTMSGKIVIRPGAQSYESLHGTAPVSYSRGYAASLGLNFSKSDSNADYQACPANVPAGKPYRWRDPKQVRIVERPTGGLLYHDFATAANPGAEGILELEQRSGLYLLTLNVRDAAADTGPFTVIGPDGPLLKDVTIKRGQYWFKTAPLRARKGRADLRFTGKWKVGALTLQPILYETEDYLFERPFWNMEVDTRDFK